MKNQWKPWLTAVLAVVGLSACQEDDGDAGGADAQVRQDGGGGGGEGGVGGGAGGEGGVGGGAGGEGGVGGGAGGEGGVGGGAGGEGGVGGGAGGEGGAGGAGGAEECAEDLQLRDPCDPEADCCARGLICVDFGLGTGAQCANVCDANGDPTGCDLRELCNAFEMVEDPEAPSPGACIPSQECDIDASAVCGDGATCFAAQNITICAPAGTAEKGAACEAFPVDEAGMVIADRACREGLTCVAGECAAPCENDMCEEGLRCVDFTEQLDGQEFSFCFGGCNIFTQDGCEANQTCVWTNTAPSVGSNAGEAMGICADEPNGQGQQNDACTPSETSYWGTCDHALCTSLSEGGDTQCLAFCDDVNRSDCTDGSVCVRDALGVDLGLCLGDCTFWPAEGGTTGCAEGEVCRFAFIGQDQAGAEAVSGICSASTQEHNTAEECDLDEATGENSCVQGHICAVTVQDAPPTCVKICQIGEGVANGCPPGFACQAVFEGEENVGACLEN